MATTRINSTDSGYSLTTGSAYSGTRIVSSGGISDAKSSFINFGSVNIPNNSYINSATIYLKGITSTQLTDNLFIFSSVINRSNFIGYNSIDEYSKDYIITRQEVKDTGSGTYSISAYELMNISKGFGVSRDSNVAQNREYNGHGTSSAPYIDVDYRNITQSDIPIARAVSERNLTFYYNPYVNFFGASSIIEAQIKIRSDISQDVFVTQTSNFGSLNVRDYVANSAIYVSVRVKGFNGVWGSYSNELTIRRTTTNKVSIVSPIGGSSYVNTSNISFSFSQLNSLINKMYLYYSYDDKNFTKLTENSGFISSYNVKASTFNQGKVKFRVMVEYDGYYSPPVDVDIYVYNEPTIDNITQNGEFWEKDCIINWRSTDQDVYEYELYYNNQLIKNGKGNTEKQFTIPASTFTGLLNSSVRIRVGNIQGVNTYWSNWLEKNLTFKDIVATITNLIVDGKYWEKPIELSWQSTDQQQFRVEAWKNNIKEYEQTGTTETRFTIPKNTLTVGEYTFKVWVAYENRFVNNQSSRATLVNVIPSVLNLSLSGSNIDYDLTLSWSSENQSIYELKVTKSDAQVLNYTGTTELFKLFPVGTLISGSTKFEIRVGYTPDVGETRWSSYQTLNIALTESKPSIGVLQPDGQLLDRELPIRAWWTSANQTNWSLTVGSEVNVSGTLEKEYIIPGGTLSAGNKTLELTVNYVTAAGVTKTAKKSTKFLIAGKPSAPTFTSATEFSTNRPLITWDSSEQEGYILNIYDSNNDLVWTTTWISGLILRQKIFEYLPNGPYKAELQIINALAEKSDVVSYLFKVNAASLTPITLSVINNTYGNELSWNNTDATYLKFYIIRSNKVIAKVDSQTQTSYNDYACKYGANEYVVRGVSDSDVFTDSNAVSVVNELNRNTLASVSNASDFIFCDKVREGGTIDINQNANSQFVHLTGRAYPIMVTSQFSDLYIALNFVNSEIQKLYNFIDSRDVFIYRDTFGNVAYVGIPESRNTRSIIDNQTSINMQLIDYKWEVDYD